MAPWRAFFLAMVGGAVATDDGAGVATLTVPGQIGVVKGVGYYYYGRRLDGTPSFVDVSPGHPPRRTPPPPPPPPHPHPPPTPPPPPPPLPSPTPPLPPPPSL